jgi:hypothetical protein
MADKRFWEMSKDEIDDWVDSRGLEAWKEKINADRGEAPGIMRAWPNPWVKANWDVKRQNIMRNLAPDLAGLRQREAESNGRA